MNVVSLLRKIDVVCHAKKKTVHIEKLGKNRDSRPALHTLASPTNRCSNQSLPKSAIFASAHKKTEMKIVNLRLKKIETKI